MEVGRLKFYWCIVVGPNPAGAFAAALCMYAFFTAVMVTFILVVGPGTMQYVAIGIVAIDTLVYFSLIFSDPGIPKCILEAIR